MIISAELSLHIVGRVTYLPIEVIHDILRHVDASELQLTCCRLRVADPRIELSETLLWRHLLVHYEGQSWACETRLKELEKAYIQSRGWFAASPDGGDDEIVRSWVQTATVKAWREDPQLLVNLLLTLPKLQSIHMTIGPTWTPEHMEELIGMLPPRQAATVHSLGVLDRVMFKGLKCKQTLEQLELRWNPYVMERSYYTFLRGAYYDTTALSLAAWPEGAAPRFTKLAFCQDLPPNHGRIYNKETPVFQLRSMRNAIDEVENDMQPITDANGKMDFAQPIVFFNLSCLTTLLKSPIARQLTHLTLRLPRRHLLLYLCVNLPKLRYLDLTNSHLSTNSALQAMLCYLYKLKWLNLDRCTGLFSRGREGEDTTFDTIEWLGKVCGGTGNLRAEESIRQWRKDLKDRPTGQPADAPDAGNSVPRPRQPRRAKPGRNAFSAPRPAPAVASTSTAPIPSYREIMARTVPIVKDVIILPGVPSLEAVAFGHNLTPEQNERWHAAFKKGYDEAIHRTVEKVDDALKRWDLWTRMGKDHARLVAFASSLPASYRALPEDEDAVFADWMQRHDLVRVDIDAAPTLKLACIDKIDTFTACFVADCSDAPGVPHLSLSSIGKEPVEERNAKERAIWIEEERQRKEWQSRPHPETCPHVERRKVWPAQL